MVHGQIMKSIFTLTALVLMPCFLNSQSCHYVHPPSAPEARDFIQPPSDAKRRFVGPVIRQVNVSCWRAEPDDANKCVGGLHGFQKLTLFLPTESAVKPPPVDFDFHQKSIAQFSAGGARSDLKSDELPPGIFVSLKGHPVYKVVKVEFPVRSPDSPTPVTGVSVQLEFSHEPSNGECYLYIAVWVATTN